MPISAAEFGCRLRQEHKATRKAERALAVLALVAAHQVSAAEDATREKNAALSAAEQLAADVARQLNAEREGHAAEKDALRSKLVAADLQAAELACQISREQEARMAALQAQAAAAAEAEGHQCDLAATRLQIADLEREIGAEEASRRTAKTVLQNTMQRALALEQRLPLLETVLQQTQQQAACAIANAAAAEAKRMAYLSPPTFPEVCIYHTMCLTHIHACQAGPLPLRVQATVAQRGSPLPNYIVRIKIKK